MSRILVVEDDQQIRSLVETILAKAQHAVTALGSVREAMVQTGPWDLLILDRRLPNGDGKRVAEHFAGTPTVYVSGYEDADLRKPFNMTQLLELVTHRLAGGS